MEIERCDREDAHAGHWRDDNSLWCVGIDSEGDPLHPEEASYCGATRPHPPHVNPETYAICPGMNPTEFLSTGVPEGSWE